MARLRAVRAAPAFSLMVALPRAVPCNPRGDPVEQPGLADSSDGASAGAGAPAFDAATVAGSRELAWVACDSSKPGAPLLTRQTSSRQHPSVCVHSAWLPCRLPLSAVRACWRVSLCLRGAQRLASSAVLVMRRVFAHNTDNLLQTILTRT